MSTRDVPLPRTDTAGRLRKAGIAAVGVVLVGGVAWRLWSTGNSLTPQDLAVCSQTTQTLQYVDPADSLGRWMRINAQTQITALSHLDLPDDQIGEKIRRLSGDTVGSDAFFTDEAAVQQAC